MKRSAIAVVVVMLAAAAGGQEAPAPAAVPPVADGTTVLGLGTIAWLPADATVDASGSADGPSKLTYSVRLGDLIPAGSTFYRESVLAAWESPLGRLEASLWAMQGCLGRPPPCQGPPALLLGLPMGVEVGPDGRPRLYVPGPWSEDWHRFTAEEKLGITLQEAAALAALVALIRGL